MSYLSRDEIININEVINTNYDFKAHKKNSDGKIIYESLAEHTALANDYFFKIYKEKELDNIFTKFEEIYLKEVSDEGIKLFRRLLVNIVNFHDFGKINPRFQLDKMDNELIEYESFRTLKSNHSIISSIIYIDYFWNEVEKLDKKSKKIIKQFLYLNSYLISKHHGDLDSFEKFVSTFTTEDGEPGDGYKTIIILSKAYKSVYKRDFSIEVVKARKGANVTLKRIKELSQEEGIYLYTYERLLFSLILACDFYSTSEFMSDVTLDNFGEIDDINEFLVSYKDTNIYKSIRDYEKNYYGKTKDLKQEKNINVLRTEMFLDAERNLYKNKDGEIFYLEAPTGAGKSNIATNLSFKLIEENNKLKKIFWVYPFNTLVEQNEANLNKIYENNENILKKIATINSVTPIKVYEDNNEELYDEDKYKAYSKALLNRQFFNYPMILITHVGIFNTMFNCNKKSIFSFHQLVNSVIVLDEIQSYKLEIWTEIITFLKVFAKLLNIKVIIMSATLPNLDVLTMLKGGTTTLIEDRDKYFNNPLFKNRVKINYDFMNKDKDDILNHIVENSKNKKKILVEFIKKKTAYEFHENLVKEDLNCEVLLLTGDDNAIDRNNILNKIKSKEIEEKGIILVATQVIEAGVDIDMDIGYKDISRLDGDEQFMGRINRSCLGEGMVYFFNIDEAKSIYKKDIRAEKEYSLINDDIKKMLTNKSFGKYYEMIMNELVKNYNTSSNKNYNIDIFFKEYVGALDFTSVDKKMRLIEDDNNQISVYLARDIHLENGEILKGTEIWNRYVELLKNNKMEYAEKEIELSKVRAKMNNFIYEVQRNNNILPNEIIGDLYYIEEGEKYFKNGKVDKEKLITGIGDFI